MIAPRICSVVEIGRSPSPLHAITSDRVVQTLPARLEASSEHTRVARQPPLRRDVWWALNSNVGSVSGSSPSQEIRKDRVPRAKPLQPGLSGPFSAPRERWLEGSLRGNVAWG